MTAGPELELPTGGTTGADLPPSPHVVRVAYVAMKPQLRGRIRRNVQTLLELGADVTMLTVASGRDFFVGLEHPRLRVEFLPARSLYLRLASLTSRQPDGVPSPTRARPVHRSKVARALLAPVFVLDLLLRWIRRSVGAAARRVVHAARGRRAMMAHLPRWARRAGWAALRLRIRLARRVRHVLRRLRRHPRLARLSAVRAARRLLRRALTLLKRWHRVDRFFAFWRDSARRGVELDPDLVVSSDLPGLVGAGRIARRLGRPHLHDCHELYLDSTSFRASERRMLAPMEARFMRRADSVLAPNASIAEEYAERYGRRPLVLRNCADRVPSDLQVRDLRRVVGLPSGTPVILYQGGFSRGRGLDVLIRSMTAVDQGAHLVMLGYGPLVDELTWLSEAEGVADRVHFVDAVPPEALPAYTASATVGVLPYQPVSRNNALTLPNKIFEYTAAGVPVVASDLPEVRLIALDAGCGTVFDPFDPDSLATALREVLDADRLPAFRAAARAYGETNAWEDERKILVGELLRLAPRLASRDGDEPGDRLGQTTPPARERRSDDAA